MARIIKSYQQMISFISMVNMSRYANEAFDTNADPEQIEEIRRLFIG